jgi:hypothetical protein
LAYVSIGVAAKPLNGPKSTGSISKNPADVATHSVFIYIVICGFVILFV